MRTRICELPDPTEHPEGKRTKWKSQALRAYQRRMLAADALIASTYLAGTNSPIRAGCAVRSPPCLDRDDTGCARPRLTRLSSTSEQHVAVDLPALGFFRGRARQRKRKFVVGAIPAIHDVACRNATIGLD